MTLSKKILFTAFLYLLITLVIYGITNGFKDTVYNYFVLLAEGFTKGHLYVSQNPSWLNELVNFEGKYYVVYPPMPAILLTPFVAIFGITFPQALLSIFIASVNVSLIYLILLKLFSRRVAIWVSFFYAFGSMLWFHAIEGSAWYISHVIANFFILLMIYEVITKKRLFLIGLLIAGAYLARLPAILSVVFVLILLLDNFFDFKKRKILLKNLSLLFSGILVGVIVNSLYNYLRFGVIYDISYSLLPIFNEPWYSYGLFNIRYIPIHLNEILTSLPKFSTTPPFVTPSLNVMALWFVMPPLLLIPFANFKSRLIIAAGVASLFIAIPSLAHGGSGFSQFGYRYALDYLPFLILIIASGTRNNINWWVKLLILLSFTINFWGIYMVRFLGKWTL